MGRTIDHGFRGPLQARVGRGETCAGANGSRRRKWSAGFGQYIIKPQIFGIIEEHIANNVRERGEIQLTSALDRLRREDGFLGLVMEGRRYDIGLPQHYLETLATFANP